MQVLASIASYEGWLAEARGVVANLQLQTIQGVLLGGGSLGTVVTGPCIAASRASPTPRRETRAAARSRCAIRPAS
jgi:hypothetical protein